MGRYKMVFRELEIHKKGEKILKLTGANK